MNTKEKIYNNIENLLKRSFEEGAELEDPDYKFKSTYLVRSKCFWNIEHFLQYVKQAIDEA